MSSAMTPCNALTINLTFGIKKTAGRGKQRILSGKWARDDARPWNDLTFCKDLLSSLVQTVTSSDVHRSASFNRLRLSLYRESPRRSSNRGSISSQFVQKQYWSIAWFSP